MIDKNGKLFGKINIIDLLIILVVVAVVVIFVTKAFTPAQQASETETSTVRLEFFSFEAIPQIADSLEVGASAFEDTTNVQFGKVVDFSAEPAKEYTVDADGNTVEIPSAYKYVVTVTLELEGNLTDSGLYIGSRLYSIGTSYTLHFGKVALYGKISALEAIG